MVEQNLRVARRLADHVVVMSEGRVERTAPASILEDEESMRRALGVYSRGGRAHG
jgi:ABC-type branched-subunit amino acid transport system ATPase component